MSWIKTGETSFTAQSAVSIDNCFSALYEHYLVVRNLLGSIGDQGVSVRLRASGVDADTNYRYQYLAAGSTTVDAARSTTSLRFVQSLGTTEVTAFGFGMFRISYPFGANVTVAQTDLSYDSDGSIQWQRWAHSHTDSTSYDGITVAPTTGTMTGSVTVYGLRES